jgi:flagellar basal-body rod protein FlgG
MSEAAAAIAALGLEAHQRQLDVIANNLANMSTAGYKAERIQFQELVHQGLGATAALDAGQAAPTQGAGVGIASRLRLFSSGDLIQTGQALDVAIRGAGFLEVVLADGTSAFARGGRLQVTADGLLADAAGNPLKQSIHVGATARDIVIQPNGVVTAKLGAQDNAVEVGRIELANFSDPSSLTVLGQNLYQPSAQSGDPVVGAPGTDGLGSLAQGFTENSNVDINTEMVQLMAAQRAYAMNLKALEAADRMATLSNELVRNQ